MVLSQVIHAGEPKWRGGRRGGEKMGVFLGEEELDSVSGYIGNIV